MMWNEPTTEENEAFIRDRLDWDRLMGAVRSVAEAREWFENGEPMSGMMFSMPRVLNELLGEKAMFALTAPPPVETERAAILGLWAKRLAVLEQMLGTAGEGRVGTLADLSQELQAIASGDHPRLFAALPNSNGRRTNSYRLAETQLEALMWEQWLQAKGITRVEARSRVSLAFGVEWRAISEWRDVVVRELGEERFSKRMEQGRTGNWGHEPDPFEGAWEMLNAAGRRYQEELKRGAEEKPQRRPRKSAAND